MRSKGLALADQPRRQRGTQGASIWQADGKKIMICANRTLMMSIARLDQKLDSLRIIILDVLPIKSAKANRNDPNAIA